MPNKKIEITIISYGIYSTLDRRRKAIPKIIKHTLKIPISLETEFGYVLEVKKAKGKKIVFRIDHPSFKGSNGQASPPYVGEQYVRKNSFLFFLGDSFSEPLSDKVGEWKLSCWIDKKLVAEKKFLMELKPPSFEDDFSTLPEPIFLVPQCKS